MMNIQITGHKISITPSIREYILQKFAKIQRHYSQVIDAHVVLEVNKLINKIEITTHLPKKDLHIEVEHSDMYAAIDIIADKMDRQIIRYKEIHSDSIHSGKSLV
ncbi:MAG: ribosomal subunit interface protein [Betaproteobacteria bacterium TMED41]|nr:MAG: ribosomal subunit interface protein [Betaproteobacteria bacterium TMED41]